MSKKINIVIYLFVIAIIVVIASIFFSDNKKNILISKIELDKKNISMHVGEKNKINLKLVPEDATNKTIKWQSNNPSVAIVDDNGIISAIGLGEADIIASASNDNIKSSCHVNVTVREIERIQLSMTNITLKVGDSYKIYAYASPESPINRKIIYKSSNPSVATIDDSGNIVAAKEGNTKIIASSENGKVVANCDVVVNVVSTKDEKKSVEKIELDKTTVELVVGKTSSLSATVLPVDADNKKITWKSSNSDVVAVNQKGEIHAFKVGTAIITVTSKDGGKEASCTVIAKEKEKKTSTGANTIKTNGQYKHVFIIGVDGVGAAFSKTSSPNINRIFSNYAYRHDVQTESVTISAQNWGSILTGVSYDIHKYTNEYIESTTHNSSGTLSIFYYVRSAIPNANLVSVVDWGPINNGIIENDIGVKMVSNEPDASVVNNVINYINSDTPPTLLFAQLDEVDGAAHASGGFSDAYYSAVRTADERIGKIYDAINNRGIMNDSLFIVVADHGETTNGHGGNTKEERSAFLGVAGRTVSQMILNEGYRNRDVAAIALRALGVSKPSHFTSGVPTGLFKK